MTFLLRIRYQDSTLEAQIRRLCIMHQFKFLLLCSMVRSTCSVKVQKVASPKASSWLSYALDRTLGEEHLLLSLSLMLTCVDLVMT